MRAVVLRPGDHMFVASTAGILVLQNITSIVQFVGKGVFAPLTFSGQLLVNGVAVSSYALLWAEDIIQEMETYPTALQMMVHSHQMMRSVDAPLRWGFGLALWAGCIDCLKWKCSERGDLRWFAFNGKVVFENLVFGLTYPSLFKHTQFW